MIYISRRAAREAALIAVGQGKADDFSVQEVLTRQPDRSYERGWRVALKKRGRFVGFA